MGKEIIFIKMDINLLVNVKKGTANGYEEMYYINGDNFKGN